MYHKSQQWDGALIEKWLKLKIEWAKKYPDWERSAEDMMSGMGRGRLRGIWLQVLYHNIMTWYKLHITLGMKITCRMIYNKARMMSNWVQGGQWHLGRLF